MSVKDFFSSKANIESLFAEKPEPSMAALKKAFLESIEENCKGIKKAAVLFSGGLDSSLIAKTISEKIPLVKLFCTALENSSALESSKSAAKLLSLPLEIVSAKENALLETAKKTSKIIGSKNFLQLQIALPEFIAMQTIKQNNFKHVFSGQGADELFFGYHSFRKALENRPSFQALERMRKEKMLNLLRDNLARDFAIAEHFSLELKTPFLEPKFMKHALAFSAKQNIVSQKDSLRKQVLRKLAEQCSLPKELTWKKKKAIQYDSGVSKKLKKCWF